MYGRDDNKTKSLQHVEQLQCFHSNTKIQLNMISLAPVLRQKKNNFFFVIKNSMQCIIKPNIYAKPKIPYIFNLFSAKFSMKFMHIRIMKNSKNDFFSSLI